MNLKEQSGNSKNNIGYVYFMTEKDLFGNPSGPYVKIGRVKGNEEGRSSIDRRKEHQTGNPRQIIVLDEVKTSASDSTLESIVHQRLANFRIHGEWFIYSDDGIKPYVELTKKINTRLEAELKNENMLEELSAIEDNGEEINPCSESEDIHQDLIKIKSDLQKIKIRKELASIKLKSLNKKNCQNIDGICSFEKSKPVEKFDKKNFEKDYPQIFDKLSKFSINSKLSIKKDVKSIENNELNEIKEIINSQIFDEKLIPNSLERDNVSIALHKEWIDAHVEIQPYEFKKKFYENKLKLIIGEKLGIKNICSWKRKLSKKISKTDLKNYDQKLASKYIKLGEPIVRFKINDFRPYPFS